MVLPDGSDGEPLTYDKFLVYARTYLCHHKNVLFKDHIWDEYTEEELIIEYFATLYRNDVDKREEFERELNKINSNYDDFLKFADEQIDKNQKEMEEEQSSLPDKLSFSPDTLGD